MQRRASLAFVACVATLASLGAHAADASGGAAAGARSLGAAARGERRPTPGRRRALRQAHRDRRQVRHASKSCACAAGLQKVTVAPKNGAPELRDSHRRRLAPDRGRPGVHLERLRRQARLERPSILIDRRMAVFTEVSFDEAARAHRQRRASVALQQLCSVLGRNREHELLRRHQLGPLRADAVRAPRRRRAAVLSRLDEAPRRARPAGAAAARRRERLRSCSRSRASPRRSSTACPAHTISHRARPTAPRSAPCSRACTSPRATSRRAQPNLRGLAWWNATVPVVLPHLDAAPAALMADELAYPAASRRIVGVRNAAARPRSTATCSATT